MSFRSTCSTNSTGGGFPLVTAQDRCPQLEADQESLTALRLEVASLEKAEKTLTALASSHHVKELSIKSGCGDDEVGRLVREVLLVNRSLYRLTLDLSECSDDGATHLAEVRITSLSRDSLQPSYESILLVYRLYTIMLS